MNLQFFDFEKAFKGYDDGVKHDQYLIDQGQKQRLADLRIQEAMMTLEENRATSAGRIAGTKASNDLITGTVPYKLAAAGRAEELGILGQPGAVAEAGQKSAYQTELARALAPLAAPIARDKAQGAAYTARLSALREGESVDLFPTTSETTRVQAGNTLASTRFAQTMLPEVLATQRINEKTRGVNARSDIDEAVYKQAFAPVRRQQELARAEAEIAGLINKLTPTEKQIGANMLMDLQHLQGVLDPSNAKALEASAQAAGLTPQQYTAQLETQRQRILQDLGRLRGAGARGGTATSTNPFLQATPPPPAVVAPVVPHTSQTGKRTGADSNF